MGERTFGAQLHAEDIHTEAIRQPVSAPADHAHNVYCDRCGNTEQNHHQLSGKQPKRYHPLLRFMQDTTGKHLKRVTHVSVVGGRLYLGSYIDPYLAYYDLRDGDVL